VSRVITPSVPQEPLSASRLWFGVTVAAFAALNLQLITATGAVVSDDVGGTVKLYHVVFVGLLVFILARRAVVRWRGEVLLYFLVTSLTGAVAYFVFGARPLLVNLLFCGYTVVIGAMLGRVLGSQRALAAVRFAAAALLAAVLIKALLYFRVFVAFFAAPINHPQIPFFYGGGPNLEATWVALAGALFVGTRFFFPYSLSSLAISMLYASRAGVVVAFLVLGGGGLYYLFNLKITPAVRVLIIGALCAGVTALLTTAVAISASDAPAAAYMVERFSSIGDEPGSVGRLRLWAGGVQVFQRYPFGVGQGNAVREVEHELGTNLPEDNLHNLFLQHLVESGIQGLLVYLIFCGMTIARLTRSRFRDPLLLYACVYMAVGAIQFRGAEAIFWFVYSLGMGSADNQ
jgi:O-antigen ligase